MFVYFDSLQKVLKNTVTVIATYPCKDILALVEALNNQFDLI